MKKSNVNRKTIDVMYEAIALLMRESNYWLTADCISEKLQVDEERVVEQLDSLVDWGLVEMLDYSIVWYKITDLGIARVIEYKLKNGLH